MKQYYKIIKCDINDIYGGSHIYEDQFLLLQTEKDRGFDIDLTGDLFFNTDFETIKIKVEKEINTLAELYEFCEENGIKIPAKYKIADGLICGGEKDFIINNNLVGRWIND